jgi:Lon-like protease
VTAQPPEPPPWSPPPSPTPEPPSPAPEPAVAAEPSPAPSPQSAGEQDLALHWRTVVLLMSAFLSVLLGSVLMLLPVPFVVLRPGPAYNTLGTEDGHPLIAIKGRASYPAKGALDLTTVSVSGGPGSRLLLFDALRAWFDESLTVAPESALYPPGQSVETSRQQDQQEMVTSQESATVAALHELGIPVPATLNVHSVANAPSGTTLRSKDVIKAIGGVAVPDLDALTTQMRKVTPGSTVSVTVQRDGSEKVLKAPTMAYDGDGTRRAVLGITVDPSFHPPFQITIRIDNVGGPSAGTMFALGIIDLLTPGDLTGGDKIAGTGTIDVSGQIGPIGGIRQKLTGARRVGAEWFLAPAENCVEVAGHVPDGLHVVKVATLSQARQAVEAIAVDKGGNLPTCTR